MPHRELIIFTYGVQAAHAFLSAVHFWMFQSAPILNLIMVVVNCCCFINAADCRAMLCARRDRAQRRRDMFRR